MKPLRRRSITGTFPITGILFFVLALFLTVGASAIEIPLEKHGGVYSLPVRINGAITLPFILDSGASEVVIPVDVVLTLVRAGTIRESDFLPGKTYTLADGSELKSPRFIIRELELGGTKILNVPGSVAPPAGDLLLGQSLLERLDSWALDNRRHVLVLNEQVKTVPSSSSHIISEQSGLPHKVTARIISPKDRQEVSRRQTIAGVLSGLTPNQQAFLVIQSTAAQYGQKIYPQSRIFPIMKVTGVLMGFMLHPIFPTKRMLSSLKTPNPQWFSMTSKVVETD